MEAGGVELLEVMGMPEDIKFEAFRVELFSIFPYKYVALYQEL